MDLENIKTELIETSAQTKQNLEELKEVLFDIDRNTNLLRTALSLACNIIATQSAKDPNVVYQEFLKEAEKYID